MNEYACSTCGFKLWLPISRLRTSLVGLYDDNRYPGRLILVLAEHAEHLHELDATSSCDFMEDARQAGAALTQVTGAQRVNYAVLGNTQPHLHWHIIPRDPATEPLPSRPPWEDPRPVAPLDPDRISDLIEDLSDALDVGLRTEGNRQG